MTIADLVQALERLATDPALDSHTRHHRLAAALAPLGERTAHHEADTLEAHGWRVRATGHTAAAESLLHAEAEVAAHRCNCAKAGVQR